MSARLKVLARKWLETGDRGILRTVEHYFTLMPFDGLSPNQVRTELGIAYLLGVNSSTKLAKGKDTVLGLYLAPASISGFEMCQARSKGCTNACLYKSGRGRFTATQVSRVIKTWFYRFAFGPFLSLARAEIESAAIRYGSDKIAVRMNATSDIDFTSFMMLFPDVQFYDYSKVGRFAGYARTANYHVTFSHSGTNTALCLEAWKQGHNLAIVVKLEDKAEALKLPLCFDGDVNDLRYTDPRGICILSLKKGGGDPLGFTVCLTKLKDISSRLVEIGDKMSMLTLDEVYT